MEVDEKHILREYENADEKTKLVFRRIFDEGIFVKKFIQKPAWIQLWDQFCLENNLNICLPYFEPKCSDEESANAYIMLVNIIRIRNGKWQPNWENKNELKYFPYFSRCGLFGFAHTSYGRWLASSCTGSRLCFFSSALAEATAKEFLIIYERFIK